MIGTLVELLSWVFLMLGSFLCVSGAFGLLRFPDFYTRMHAAGVTDTLGSGLVLAGLALQSGGDILVLAKLGFIFLFILFANPTATHALAMAALRGGLKPQLGPGGSAGSTAAKAGGERPSNS